jgi:hypothetical protein
LVKNHDKNQTPFLYTVREAFPLIFEMIKYNLDY